MSNVKCQTFSRFTR